MSKQTTLDRLAKRLGIPREHNPALVNEHGLCGCVECYLAWNAKPPPIGELEQLVQNLRVAEMFNGREPSPALRDLLAYVDRMKTQQKQNAKAGKPRRSKKQEAKLAAAREVGEPVPDGEASEASREQLLASRSDWIASRGSARGWLNAAALTFKLTEKTIRNRIR